jgi:hypothetical protein
MAPAQILNWQWQGGQRTARPAKIGVSCLEDSGRMLRRRFESCALHEKEIGWNYIFDGAD